MGGHIAAHLIPLLEEADVPAATHKQPAGRSNGSGDGAEMEEEAGDPKRLSKGYVFVRKTDLH